MNEVNFVRCEFDFCIYNMDNECTVKEIAVDSIGVCETCIMISLPKEKLIEYKKEQLKEIIERYKDMQR